MGLFSTARTFSSSQIVNDAITSTLMESASNCSSSASSGQTINMSKLKLKNCRLISGGITQNSSIQNTLNCLQTGQFSADIQNKFENKLKEELTNKISGLDLGVWSSTEAESYSSIVNRIMTSVNMISTARCISETMAGQSYDMSGSEIDCTDMSDAVISGGITQIVAVSAVTKCIQQNAMTLRAMNELDNLIQKKIDNSISGLEIGMILLVVIIIGIIILALIIGFNPITWIFRAISSLFSGSSKD